MSRLLFEKTDNAIYISHLDLMRLFQRAFKRAGLKLTHTQGYNPRPSVSIALPLSLGTESHCELLDFDLEGEIPSCEKIMQRLNAALLPGIRVLRAYTDGRKIKHLAYLDCTVTLEYDNGIPAEAAKKITALFSRPSLSVEKKGKNGPTQQDIIPMIRQLSVAEAENCVVISARICCQNPTLNPTQLVVAIENNLPDCRPDFARCYRNEIYDTEENTFR